MGLNKTEAARSAGIDLAVAADVPPPEFKSQSVIGAEIVRRAAYGKVTTESISTYLESLRKCGIRSRAAASANLSYSSVLNLRKRDPVFAEEEESAMQHWIAVTIDEPFQKIGIVGEPKYGINQKTGARVQIGIERSPQIALAFARKFDPAYREKQEVDVKHGGQVVVVTAKVAPKDLEEYARQVEADAAREHDNAARVVADSPSLPPS